MEKMDADLLFENFRLALKFIKMNGADHIKCKYDNVLKNISDLRIGQVISNWGEIKRLADDVITNFDKISKNDPSHLLHIETILESCKDLNFFEIVENLEAGSVTQFNDCLENVGWNSTSQVSDSVNHKDFQNKLSSIQVELQSLSKNLPLLKCNLIFSLLKINAFIFNRFRF